MRTDIQTAAQANLLTEDTVEEASWLETATTSLAVIIAVGVVSFVAVVMSMS